MDLNRSISLTTNLIQRRHDLQRLFGAAAYSERVTLAKERIREVMATRHDDNPIAAAIAFCTFLAQHHPGKDVTTSQQFVLCAAADLAEGK